jgi:hypothetical protein
MDLLKNRETPDNGIPRRLAADTVESAVIREIRRVLRTPETTAQIIATLGREGNDVISEAKAIAALNEFEGIWGQLFPAEQTRIIQLLVRRVTVTGEGMVIDLRTDGIAGVMRELMMPRKTEAAA